MLSTLRNHAITTCDVRRCYICECNLNFSRMRGRLAADPVGIRTRVLVPVLRRFSAMDPGRMPVGWVEAAPPPQRSGHTIEDRYWRACWSAQQGDYPLGVVIERMDELQGSIESAFVTRGMTFPQGFRERIALRHQVDILGREDAALREVLDLFALQEPMFPVTVLQCGLVGAVDRVLAGFAETYPEAAVMRAELAREAFADFRLAFAVAVSDYGIDRDVLRGIVRLAEEANVPDVIDVENVI